MAVTSILPATEPFDFNRTLEFISGFSPQDGEHRIEGARLRKGLDIGGECVVCDVTEAPGGVELTTHGPASLHSETQVRLTRMLGLDHDLRPMYVTAEDDPVMAPLIARAHGFHHVEFPTPFECAAWGVINQRVGQRVARRWKDAITLTHGPSCEVEGTVYRAFPSAQVVRDAPDLDRLVPNRQRHRALAGVAAAFADADEDHLRTAPFDEVRDWLLGITGVGDWTATFVLARGLSRWERVILLPRFVEEIASRYGVGADEVPAIVDRYGDHQGLWLLYLRVAGTYGVVTRAEHG